MFKKVFILLLIVLSCVVFIFSELPTALFGNKNSKEVNSQNTKKDLQVESAKKEATLKKDFFARFEKRFPKELLENLNKNFASFLAEANTLLANDGELLVLVDKKNLIAKDFKLGELVLLEKYPSLLLSKKGMYASTVAIDALLKMSNEARKEGINIVVSSAYRSYSYQKNLFDRYSKNYGVAEAERFSARAGTSQHQLGTVFDFGSISDDWAKTKAGKWVNANAYKFGFSLSFPKGYEAVTGYKWECWHFRYIGIAACAMQAKYFGNIQQYMLEALDFLKKQDPDLYT